MKTVALLSQKGGSGKTTLALHLAVAAERSGISTVVVDLDPQASASGWGDSRLAETPAVVSCQAARLGAVLLAAKDGGAGLAIIDTAPHSESAALAAARAADLVLITCRPSILDLRAISSTIDLVKIAGKPAFAILNGVPARGSLASEAAEAIAGYDAVVAPVHLGQRAAFSNSLTSGLVAQEYESGGKASDEVAALFAWLADQIGLSNHEPKTKAKPHRGAA